MKVYVIVEHYDRGSDEVNVAGVYSDWGKAAVALLNDFPGYTIIEGDEPEPGSDCLNIWHYADGDDSADRVMIVEQEVQ